MNSFLFWIYGIGIFIAVCQDIKRREVDNWLNLLLLISGSAFVIFNSSTVEEIFLLIFTILFFFVLSNAFYYARFFAGGDAKLLFSMAPMFAAVSFATILTNTGIFLFLLMISGSIYGIAYSTVLGIKHAKEIRKVFGKEGKKIYLRQVLLVSAAFMLFGFLFRFLLMIGFFLFIFSLLYVFAKSLEKVAMYRKINVSLLREGDWLVNDVKVGGKTIKANFEGLSNADIKLIQKNKKEILIKGGLPFVPAFVIAFVVYIFSRSFIAELFRVIL